MIRRNSDDNASNSDPSAIPEQSGGGGALYVLWHRPWALALGVIVAIVPAAFYLSNQIPIYNSTSRLYVQQYTKVLGANNTFENPSGAATQAELISSAPLLAEVAARPDAQRMEIINGLSNPALAIKSALSVVPEGDFVNITYESPNRVEAAQLVNAIADTYISFIARQHQSTAAEVLKLLQKEKDKREKELDERRKAALDFKRKHGVLSFQDERGNIVMQRLSKLSEMLTTTQLEAIDAQTNLDAIEAIKNDPARLLEFARSEEKKDMELNVDRNEPSHDQVNANLLASGDSIRQAIAETERRIERLRRTRTPLHKDVLDADLDLTILKDQLKHNETEILERKQKLLAQEQEMARSQKMQDTSKLMLLQEQKDRQMVDGFMARAKRRATMAKQREAELQKNFDDQKQQAFDLNSLAAESASLETEANRSDRLVNMLQDRIKDINVSEDTNMVTAAVISVATPADDPIRPNKRRVLGIGLLLGLLLGWGIAMGLDRIDQRIHSTEEAAALLGAPVLGLVPNISNHESASVRGRKLALEPTSDVSESYRTIRTAVYFAAREEKTKKLLITSPAPGDGKTTCASNLAIAMAQAGRRVLLVDGDFRRPRQHKIFEIKVEVGISNVMAGLAPLEKAIHRTAIENLHLLPCGPIPSNPSEMLNGQAFADILEGLERNYDHIIIDSPPIAPVTDAWILGALCDETIVVIRAEKTTRRIAEHARDSLRSVGANILGVIINDVPSRGPRYGYYYGYGGYYRYGYGYGYRSYKYKYKYGEKAKKDKENVEA